ncbi:MFS transporter [Tropicimonas sp. IMCC34043]|uniref:MFS transporter n=1 Tax=Tropicimonas sp. IMCC34043 TaxID=2248760 RepID=UPI000E224404|nr:MFS transporter [Tropicimonas sp. IMCC34043]
MPGSPSQKRRWGWYFFDWASQPYNTLLITFIFGPYVKDLLSDGAAAQALWGYTIGATGIVIALLAPFLGAAADRGGHRIGWIVVFSALYVLGAAGVWLARPEGGQLPLSLGLFALGIIGMEFATIFTNAMLPGLGPKHEIGRISGTGWAFGYVGGLAALVIMLLAFAESPSGTTLLGRAPAFGLDPATREGTRFVGPFTALWYLVFMVPFFLWVRDPGPKRRQRLAPAVKGAWNALCHTVRALPRQRSFSAFLLSSMFYRDALNGLYIFGGLYAAGVLGWGVIDTGLFGILALVFSALFAWVGGRADRRFGPALVIRVNLVVLTAVCSAILFVSREHVFGFAVAPASRLPDIAFYAIGALIGGAGGALQPASRTMVCHQAEPAAITQAFGLFALTGKATAFLAPLSIAVVTDLTGSQQLGIIPVIGLFLLGLMLFTRVKPKQERAEWAASETSSSQV